MSHVDDGELTAYADGAYPASDPVALRIAAHLSTCGNCRTRLEQSHELRDRAAEILAFAAPATLVTPSFESLQAQAATPTRARRRTIPLAWAASVILAIGLGWFGRDALLPTAKMSEMMVQQDEPAANPEAAEDAVATTPPPAAVPMTSQSARRAAPARDMAANRGTVEGGTGAAAPSVTQPSIAAVAAPPPPPTPPPSAVSELAQRVELAELVVTGVATEYITAAEAERRGIHVPRIPELPIARVGLQGGTTIVEQLLPDEKVVTLTVTNPAVGEARAEAQQDAAKMRERAAPAAAASAPVAAAAPQPNVMLRVGERTITVSGSLSPDSLRALGRKIR